MKGSSWPIKCQKFEVVCSKVTRENMKRINVTRSDKA